MALEGCDHVHARRLPPSRRRNPGLQRPRAAGEGSRRSALRRAPQGPRPVHESPDRQGARAPQALSLLLPRPAAAQLRRPGPGHQLHRRRVAAAGQGRDGAPPQPRRPARSRSWRCRPRPTRTSTGQSAPPTGPGSPSPGRRRSSPTARRHQELHPDDGLLLRGLPARDPPADPEDPARGAEGLLRGQARRGSPRGRGRGRAAGRAAPADAPGPQLLAQPVPARRRVARSSPR